MAEIPYSIYKELMDMVNKYRFYYDILMQIHEIYN